MKSLVRGFLLVYLLLINIVFGQQDKLPSQESYILEPREDLLPTVVYQPGCPLEYKKAIVLHNIDGGGINLYQLQNRSNKPIQSYMVSIITSYATGTEVKFTAKNSDDYILPGQIFPQREIGSLKVIPLSEELRKKTNVNGTMKAIAIFMVVRVEFSDGSSYSDEAVYNSLKAFFDKNSIVSK